MALFGKSDSPQALLKKVESGSYQNKAELQDWLNQIDQSGELQVARNLWMLSHRDAEVRAFLTDRIQSMGADTATCDALLRQLPQAKGGVLREMAILLMKLDGDRQYARLGPLLHSTKAEQREIALELIAADTRWDRCIGYLKAALKDPEPAIRRKAVRILAPGAQQPTIFLMLRDLLFDEDPDLRSVVIHALAGSEDPEIVEPFLERLPHESPSDREVMVKALMKLARDPRARLQERVVPVLADESEEVRDAAVRLLQALPNLGEVLRAFLVESKGLAHWLRDRCTQSIMKVAANLTDAFIELMDDADEDVRVGAMNLAARSKDPRILPAVKRIFLGKSDWWVRSLAAETMAMFPERETIELLASRLHDQELRYGILSAMGIAGNPLVLPHLLGALKDPERGIRVAALTALEGQKDPMVVKAVLYLAGSDPDHTVREKATQMLHELEDHGKAALQQLEAYLHGKAAKEGTLQPEITLEMENTSLNSADGPARSAPTCA